MYNDVYTCVYAVHICMWACVCVGSWVDNSSFGYMGRHGKSATESSYKIPEAHKYKFTTSEKQLMKSTSCV